MRPTLAAYDSALAEEIELVFDDVEATAVPDEDFAFVREMKRRTDSFAAWLRKQEAAE